MTPELAARRTELAGSEATPIDFPLEILFARKLITEEQRDEGMRFAMLAWWLYGTPSASCEAVYARMITQGMGSEFGPTETAAEDPARIARIQRDKARFERMVGALRSGKTLLGYTPIAGTALAEVRATAQFLQVPLAVQKMAKGFVLTAADHLQIARLVHGLARLVALREEEERRFRLRRAVGLTRMAPVAIAA